MLAAPDLPVVPYLEDSPGFLVLRGQQRILGGGKPPARGPRTWSSSHLFLSTTCSSLFA